VEVALSLPVAEIATRMLPRSTWVVRQSPSSLALPLCCQNHQPAAAASTTATITTGRERPRRAERGRAGLRDGWFIAGLGPESGNHHVNARHAPALTPPAMIQNQPPQP